MGAGEHPLLSALGVASQGQLPLLGWLGTLGRMEGTLGGCRFPLQAQGLSPYIQVEGCLRPLPLQDRSVFQDQGTLHKLEGKSRVCPPWSGAGPWKQGAV